MNKVPSPQKPRDAVTIVVIRPASTGIEIFCVQRHQQSGFLGGAIVFPGGKVDPDDYEPRWTRLSTSISARAREGLDDEAIARAFCIAALRELLEEGALLPVVNDTLDAAEVIALRDELTQNAHLPQAFATLVEKHELRLDTSRLTAFSRWITPTTEIKRFDTRFYLLELPSGQHGVHDNRETTSSFWATPSKILELWKKGEVVLAPPTSRTVEFFQNARDVHEAFDLLVPAH